MTSRVVNDHPDFEFMKNLVSSWIDSVENDDAGNINLHLDQFIFSKEIFSKFKIVFDEVLREVSNLPEEMGAVFLRGLIKIQGVEFGSYKKEFILSFLSSFDGILKE